MTPDPTTTAGLDEEIQPLDDNGGDTPLGTLEATAADVAEQRAGVRDSGHDPEPAWEADAADVAEQRVPVGLDEDEYRA